MSKRINRDDVDRFHDYDLYLPTRTIILRSENNGEDGESGVDSDMAQRAIKNLHILDSMSPNGDQPIYIIMNSPGGDGLHGMSMYDAISSCKNHITITITGYGMSIAAWILQAADHRIMAKHSRLMIHTGYVGLSENHPEINKRWMKQFDIDEEEFENILLEKIKIKKPNFTKNKMKEMLRFDTIFTPEQALELNLIDEIL